MEVHLRLCGEPDCSVQLTDRAEHRARLNQGCSALGELAGLRATRLDASIIGHQLD